MKKLTTSVLAVVLTSSFAVSYAQKAPKDTLKTQEIEEILFVQPITGKLKVKDEVTSAQQIIGGEQLTQAANPNIINALAGKASSVRINQTNSSVNSSQSIVIRTGRTITGSNEALVVIDNVPSTATVLNQLPGDIIESVNIIKGSAGAAIYGPAGVNGVVVVTTKRGTAGGKMRVKLESSVDFESVAYLPERQREYGQGWDGYKVSVENGAWGPAYNNPAYANQYLPYGPSYVDMDGDGIVSFNPADDEYTADDAGAIHSFYRPFGKDNVKDFFQTGTIFQNSLTVSAGTNDQYFSMNLGSIERQFVVMDDKLSRYTAMMKGGAKFGKLKVDGQFNFSKQKTTETNSEIYHDLLQAAYDVPITMYKDYPDRPYAWNAYYGNPYFTIKHNRYNSLRNYFNVIGSAAYSFNDHITLTYRGNYNFTNVESNQWNDGWADDGLYDGNLSDEQSFYYQSGSNIRNFYGDLILNFNYDLTKDLNLDFTVGHNYQDFYQNNTQQGGTGLQIPGIYAVWNVANQAQPISLANSVSSYNSHAFFANLDLDYKKYLFLNVVGRYELNSKLRNVLANNDYDFFYPAVSLSFVPTKAFNFGGDVLNYMKVTAAWQKVGNASPLAAYAIYPYATLGSAFPYANDPSSQLSFGPQSSITNPLINPEFITKKEIGLSLGLFKDRITFDGAVYEETTEDLITSQATSHTSGISSRRMNLGDLRGRGIELNLNLVPVKTSDVRWDFGVNFSSGETKILKLAEDAKEISILAYSFAGIYAIEGESFPVIKGTTYERDDQGRVVVDATTGLPKVNSALSVLGRMTPKYILGFNTSLKVKGFTLSATADYRTGHKFFSGTLQSFSFSGQNPASAGFDRTQAYIIPNSVYVQNGAYVANTDIPLYASTYNNPNYSGYNPYTAVDSYFSSSLYTSVGENFVLDATAFKLREVALSYTLPKSILNGTGINDVTVGVHARNIWNKYAKENKNFDDPETGYEGTANYTGFVGTGAVQYPNLKSFGASVSLTF